MRRDRRTALLVAALALGCSSNGYDPELADGVPLSFSVLPPEAVSAAETTTLAAAFDRVDRYEIEIVLDASGDLVTSATISVAPGAALHLLDIVVPNSALGRTVRITLVGYDGDEELYRSVAVTTISATGGTTRVDLVIRYSGPGIRGTVVDDQGNGIGGATVNLDDFDLILDAVQTEPDGTFLFLDVPVGTFQVVVPPPGQTGFVCPGSRSVNVVSATDAIVTNFRVSTTSCGNDVLILSGGDVSADTLPVRQMLSQDQSLTISTFFFTNRSPGLSALRQYDVVLLFTNGLFDETRTLGNELAQYVGEGGNLVIASFYWQNRADSGLDTPGWGALEPLDPFTSTGGATYQTGSMDGQSVQGHPLTVGVQAVTSTGFWGGVAAKPQTTVLASWASGGGPFIGFRLLAGGQRIVGVSLFPASGTSATGDWQQAFLNAVAWAGSAGGPVP